VARRVTGCQSLWPRPLSALRHWVALVFQLPWAHSCEPALVQAPQNLPHGTVRQKQRIGHRQPTRRSRHQSHCLLHTRLADESNMHGQERQHVSTVAVSEQCFNARNARWGVVNEYG